MDDMHWFRTAASHTTVHCGIAPHLEYALVRDKKKTGSFSLIERVILSAGAMLIFSVSFQIDQMPEGSKHSVEVVYISMVGGALGQWLVS